jgi:hypothetical protein
MQQLNESIEHGIKAQSLVAEGVKDGSIDKYEEAYIESTLALAKAVQSVTLALLAALKESKP